MHVHVHEYVYVDERHYKLESRPLIRYVNVNVHVHVHVHVRYLLSA